MVILYSLRRCYEKRHFASAKAYMYGRLKKEVLSDKRRVTTKGGAAILPSAAHRRSSRRRRLDAAVLVDFGGGAHDQPALFAVHAGELLGEQSQLAGGFLVEAPHRGRPLFGDAQLLDGSFIVGEELMQRDLQSARE